MPIAEYIIPDQELPEEARPSEKDRGFWFVRCPKCGEVHQRESKTGWEDEPMGDGVYRHDYFICMRTYTHFRIRPAYPFSIEREKVFRLLATEEPLGKQRPSDDNIPF